MMKKRSVMWEYIAQEPEILSRVLRSKDTDVFAREAGTKLQAVYFVAHGSSCNAAVSISNFMSSTARLRVYAYTPGSFRCSISTLEREEREEALVVAISQTGTSSGVIDALEHANALGFPTLAITDVLDSPLARKARRVLPLLCGEERSNAKTKGYSATLLLLLKLSISLGSIRGAISGAEAEVLYSELEGMIEAIPSTAEKTHAWCERTGFGAELKSLYVLGSGVNFGTALEGQLKLMETMCMPTMFNDIGEFSHGMHRSITAESSILLFKSGDAFDKLTEDAFTYLRTISNHVLLVDATGTERDERDCITLPRFSKTQSVLLTTLVVQVLSVFAPEQVGQDPNRDAHNSFTDYVKTRVQ